MTLPTRRVVLHIGLHKTGTTYLQRLWRANRRVLAEDGVLFPGGPGRPSHEFAAYDLLGWQPRGVKDARLIGAWQSTVDEVRASPQPVTLLSDEHLSLATVKQAKRAVRSFAGSQVHILVTARDLARVVVSSWEEEVKNQGTWTWADFAAVVRNPAALARDPARGFWLRQDLPAILDVWRAAVPVEQISVVTLPPADTDPALLVERVTAAVGFGLDALPTKVSWTNESLGVAGTEMLRRLNSSLGDRLNQRQYKRAVTLAIGRAVAQQAAPVRFLLPPEDFEWVLERARQMIQQVEAGGYRVVGDLDDLRPRPTDGRRPDEVTDAEVLDAALVGLSGLAELYGTAAWSDQAEADTAPAGSAAARAASQTRALAYRGKQTVARLADTSPIAEKTLGAYLKARSAARRRSAYH